MSNVRACKPGCLCRPACRRACVHAYLYIYIYRYRYIDIDIYIYICIYVCVCVSVCVSVSLFVRVCVCVAFAAEFMQKLENIFAPVCSRKLAFPSFPSFPTISQTPLADFVQKVGMAHSFACKCLKELGLPASTTKRCKKLAFWPAIFRTMAGGVRGKVGMADVFACKCLSKLVS